MSALKAELESWIGTPFRHRCGVKGGGVDCIHLVVRVLEAFGHPPVRIPPYSKDWHIHNGFELLLTEIRTQLQVDELDDLNRPEDGDIYLFKFGKALSHAGIYCDGLLYHSVFGCRVVAVPWTDSMWSKRKGAGFRPRGIAWA